MKKKIVAISLAAIVVISFVAAMPTALGQDDVNLTVTRIDPKYVFEDLDNVIIGWVKNTGTTATTTGNVCLVVTNAAGVVCSEKNTDNLPVPAGATVEVKFQCEPTELEDVTLTVTADCDGDIAETDETDNSRTEVRNATGDCSIDTALPTTWMLPAACYGYRGQNPMDTRIAGSGNLIFTTGDYKYKYNTTVDFEIGAGGDTNRIACATADIPDGAEINMARLYVYYCWRDNVVLGYPELGMQFNGNPVSEDVNYTDWKGFGLSTYYGFGTIAYDVTNYVTGDGVYTAEITDSQWVPYQWTKGAVSGMALLIAYTDPCAPNIEYYVDEGCDRVATNYWYWNDKAAKDYKRWHYYVTPEVATTTASFPCIDNPPEEIARATLFTATIDANYLQETLYFNCGGPWVPVWWTESYHYPIGTDARDVTDELLCNTPCEPEIARFQEATVVTKNGFTATNAILIVEKTADVTIEPETLNLKSNGEWITAYIELPDGDNVADIDVNTVLLDCEIPAENDPQYGFVNDPNSYLVDHDGDGILERMVKFDRTAVIDYLQQADYDCETGIDSLVELCVTGEAAGKQFKGCDTITVIEPGN